MANTWVNRSFLANEKEGLIYPFSKKISGDSLWP